VEVIIIKCLQGVLLLSVLLLALVFWAFRAWILVPDILVPGVLVPGLLVLGGAGIGSRGLGSRRPLRGLRLPRLPRSFSRVVARCFKAISRKGSMRGYVLRIYFQASVTAGVKEGITAVRLALKEASARRVAKWYTRKYRF
jgi:hypothetical protein